MTILLRRQIGAREGVDITVKSADGCARAFAPTWDMVMGYKRRAISSPEYTRQYMGILSGVTWEQWAWLEQQSVVDKLTLLCYCEDGSFCHTYLLIQYMVERWPDRYTDGTGYLKRMQARRSK